MFERFLAVHAGVNDSRPDGPVARWGGVPQLGRLTVLSDTPPSTTSVAPTT